MQTRGAELYALASNYCNLLSLETLQNKRSVTLERLYARALRIFNLRTIHFDLCSTRELLRRVTSFLTMSGAQAADLLVKESSSEEEDEEDSSEESSGEQEAEEPQV